VGYNNPPIPWSELEQKLSGGASNPERLFNEAKFSKDVLTELRGQIPVYRCCGGGCREDAGIRSRGGPEWRRCSRFSGMSVRWCYRVLAGWCGAVTSFPSSPSTHAV